MIISPSPECTYYAIGDIYDAIGNLGVWNCGIDIYIYCIDLKFYCNYIFIDYCVSIEEIIFNTLNEVKEYINDNKTLSKCS